MDNRKLPDEKLSPLLHRCAIPDDWRVVLIRPAQGQGLSGTEERQAFEGAPAVDPRVSKSLRNEVAERMLPALAEGNFEGFSASVYRFGKTAGECFSAVQQGPYHGPLLTGIVETARNLGVTGVGQSSWGPTIYCLLPDAVSAAGFADKMKSSMTSADLECVIAQPCNLGAIVKKLKTVVPAR